MSMAKRICTFMAATAFIIVFSLLHELNTYDSLRSRVQVHEARASGVTKLENSTTLALPNSRFSSELLPWNDSHLPYIRPWPLKSPRQNYSKVVVVPCLRQDDVSWIKDELPDMDRIVYIADDREADLHPPRNKGHEVMIYLTYIIDHYDSLPDTIIFIHAHRWTHHNIELLNHDSAEMIRRLSNEYVAREGYVNMRCQWYPGCPKWLNPNDTEEILGKQEQVVVSKSWHELFPPEVTPESLGQACCAQFAVSKDRILSIPLSRFIFYRDWILKTPLSDFVSGRIWEYLWQYIFTGRSIHCPSEHACHCRGFGLCFGSEAKYREYEELRHSKEMLEVELKEVRGRGEANQSEQPIDSNLAKADISFSAKLLNLSVQVDILEQELRERRLRVVQSGTHPQNQIL